MSTVNTLGVENERLNRFVELGLDCSKTSLLLRTHRRVSSSKSFRLFDSKIYLRLVVFEVGRLFVSDCEIVGMMQGNNVPLNWWPEGWRVDDEGGEER